MLQGLSLKELLYWDSRIQLPFVVRVLATYEGHSVLVILHCQTLFRH